MRVAALIVIVTVLSGCAGGSRINWRSMYVPLKDPVGETARRDIKVRVVPHAEVEGIPPVEGFECVGISSFSGDNSSYRQQSLLWSIAEENGAHLVLWGAEPTGTQARTVMVPTGVAIPPPVPAYSPAQTYDVNSRVYTDRGSYEIRGQITQQPTYNPNALGQTIAQSMAAGAASRRPETVYVPRYHYRAVFYRRVAEEVTK